jgi:hypothetical protein
MSVKEDNGMFNLRFSNDGGRQAIKDKIDQKFDAAKKEVIGKAKKAFGSNFVNEDMFETGIAFKNRRDMFEGASGGSHGNDLYRQQLASVYKDIWKERFEKLQSKHDNKFGKHTPHTRYKRKNKGNPAYHADKKIKYTDHTRWTGLMYDSIMEAFDDGGNKYFSTTNLLLSGGFRMNKGEFPRLYFQGGDGRPSFTEWFRQQGILKGDIFQVDNNRWSQIAEMMENFVRKGFVAPLVDALNELELKV